MAQCERAQTALADYVEGSLRGRARARVEAHLRDCADCRAEVAALERTGELLKDARAIALIAGWMVRPQEAPIAAPTVQQAEIDEEFQSTLEGHLSAIWVTPLADEAALGLQMADLGEEG